MAVLSHLSASTHAGGYSDDSVSVGRQCCSGQCEQLPASSDGLAMFDAMPGAATSPVKLHVASLPNGALGQTTGHSITLDDNAAGHGWYIDYTPYLNEEYLPTANPNVWQAKEGSDAAGKMDMLSVLLHEYGHVLGIEHSADQHAAMASTLTPGTRRLPTADELALMAQLVGEVETGLTNTPETPPTSPLPLGTALGGFWLARMRKSAPGEAVTGATANTDPSATPRYAVAAHATLTNPAFTGGAGWSTAGTVTFDSGSATLTESVTAQTRLNQLFVLGAQDRFLRFTLADIALDDVNGAPDAVQGSASVGSAGRAGPTDVFEAALKHRPSAARRHGACPQRCTAWVR